MKTINVSRLWEGIPGKYILGVLGADTTLDKLWEIQEITLGEKIKFHMIHLEQGDTGEVNYTPIPHFTEHIREYFRNPKNLLIFTHRILDRVMEHEGVIRDIQSQYFERGRKRKYLLDYMEFHPLHERVRLAIEDLISKFPASPPLIMWILEALRENYPPKMKPLEFRTSDGEVRTLYEDTLISDFPRVHVYNVSHSSYSMIFSSLPYYHLEGTQETITNPDVRYRILHNLPVHSMFLRNVELSTVFAKIAARILRFIDKYLLTEFENILGMTLKDVYYCSWVGIEKERIRPILSYPNVAEAAIASHLKEEKDEIIAEGIDGSEYLRTTTIKEFLKNVYEELNS